MKHTSVAAAATLLTAASLGLGLAQTATAAPAHRVVPHQGAVSRAQLPSKGQVWVDQRGDLGAATDVVRGMSAMNDMLCGPSQNPLRPVTAVSAEYGQGGMGYSARVTEMGFRTSADASAARRTIVGWYEHCVNRLNGATGSRLNGMPLAGSTQLPNTRSLPVVAVGMRASAPATDVSRDVENTTVAQIGNRLMVISTLTENRHACSLGGRQVCGVYTQSPVYLLDLAK